MKIIYINNGILIEPETDFEIDFLKSFGYNEKEINTYLECGINPKDILGLKIIRKKKLKNEN